MVDDLLSKFLHIAIPQELVVSFENFKIALHFMSKKITGKKSINGILTLRRLVFHRLVYVNTQAF